MPHTVDINTETRTPKVSPVDEAGRSTPNIAPIRLPVITTARPNTVKALIRK